MMMTQFSIIFIISATLAWFITWLTIKNASSFGLVHLPNQRSSHHKITPHGGGVAIAITTLLMGFVLLLGNEASWVYWSSLGIIALVATIGLIDDIYPLSAKLRLAIQMLAVALLVWTVFFSQVDLRLSMIGQWLIVLVWVLSGVWWLNLFNFMDGIDGIAASQGIFMLSAAMGLMSVLNADLMSSSVWLWMLAFVAAMAGFLLHNWSPARIFMGDVGSNFVAIALLFLALLSIAKAWVSIESWLILAAIFISDASVTLIRRLLSGQNVLQAHRSHAYQRLSRQWQSHARVTLSVIAINVVWLLPLAYWANTAKGFYGWGLLLMAYLPIVWLAYYLGAGKQDSE